MRDFGYNRMVGPGNGTANLSVANWMDSLPRRDLYNMPSNSTNSLPRRDRAGLGRPEPFQRNTSVGVPPDSGSDNGANSFGMPRRRDSSLNRENPFRDVLQAKGNNPGSGRTHWLRSACCIRQRLCGVPITLSGKNF